MSTLSPRQLEQVVNRTVKKLPLSFVEYDPALYDANIVGMRTRLRYESELFSPEAKRIYAMLSNSWLWGEAPDFENVPFLVSIARRTQNDQIREHAVGALQRYIADCSGTDQSLKSAAVELLISLGFEPDYYIRNNTNELIAP